MSAVIPELVEDIQKRRDGEAPEPGIPSGFQLFDRKLGGWRRKPYIIAGRPGMGKSALVAQCCAQVAVAGYAAILISLEMDRSELATRLLSSYARVPYRKIESADLLESQWNDVKAASHVLRHIPLSIVRAPAVTVARVRTIIRQEMARLRGVYGEDVELGMVAVDYVQLIDGEQRRNESRDSELS
ncbi:MAG: hypothetical protein GWO21_03950, partial [Gammaproteobacteria bacterium]|nr:hypothetical protein [Gammaproteobacteria bacterium]